MKYPSIEKYRQLIKERNAIQYWEQNIIDAEQLIKSEEEAKHFYQFVIKPGLYDPDTAGDYKTLGEAIDNGEASCLKIP